MSEAAQTRLRRAGKAGRRSKRSSAPLSVNFPKILSVSNLYKSYYKGRMEVPVLKGIDAQLYEGEFTAIVGQSGSGKSTLLHLLGTLDAPDQGEIWFQDRRVDNLPARQRERIRNRDFGMIFQFYHLLPELTTVENVLVPRMVQDNFFRYMRNKKKYVERAKELLDTVGLSHRLNHRPNQLSGGEMQRTAIARALISEPTVLLADEPTGNLDGDSGSEVMETLHDLQRTERLTIVMVTHDNAIAEKADRIIRLVDGKVE